jgi:MFS family permease
VTRDFRLIWLASSLSVLGDAVVPVALAIAVTRAGGSAGALATVLACALVPRLALLPLGGVVADRWSPRLVLLGTDLLRAAAQAVIGVELILGGFRLVDIAVAVAVGGAASAFAAPTGSPLVAATVAPEHRQRANALLGTSAAGARVLGPALAGTLILLAGPGLAFLADAASFVLSAALLTLARVGTRAAGIRRALRRDLIEGWVEVRRHDWYWTSLIGHATWNFAAGVLLTLGPLIAVRRLGGEGVWIAVAQAGAVGMLCGALLATRLRPARPVLAANLGLATYGVPLLLLGVDAPAPALLAGYAAAMVGLGYLNPVWETAVQRHIPADRLARVTSYDWLVSLAAMPLGYAAGPIAADAFGDATPLLVTAALVVVTTAGTAFVPGVRRLRSEPAGAGVRPGVRRPDLDGGVQDGESVRAGEDRVEQQRPHAGVLVDQAAHPEQEVGERDPVDRRRAPEPA